MASVYKPTYKRPIPDGAKIITRQGERLAQWEDGRGRKRTAPLSEAGTEIVLEYSCYYIDYTDKKTGVRETEKGFKNLAATQAKARQLEDDSERRAAGLITYDPAKVSMPLLDAVGAWVADLTRRGKSAEYVYNMQLLMEKMAAGCKWPTLGSIRSDSLTTWLGQKRTRRTGEPLSGRSQNQYLETARAFINWCCDQKPPWLEDNPLSGVGKADESDKRREKRAFTPAELERLRAVAEPKGRWVVYIAAALTGLRLSELERLQWGDVHLDADQPHIRLRAKATKARRADTVPINPELLEVLRRHRPAGVEPADPVFKTVPKYATFRKDVEKRAKIPWRDGQGRLASFHALRKTFCTYLALADVPIREAMEAMRVTEVKLLTDTYTDAKLFNTAAAVNRLPRLVRPPEEEGGEAQAVAG